MHTISLCTKILEANIETETKFDEQTYLNLDWIILKVCGFQKLWCIQVIRRTQDGYQHRLQERWSKTRKTQCKNFVTWWYFSKLCNFYRFWNGLFNKHRCIHCPFFAWLDSSWGCFVFEDIFPLKLKTQLYISKHSSAWHWTSSSSLHFKIPNLEDTVWRPDKLKLYSIFTLQNVCLEVNRGCSEGCGDSLKQEQVNEINR